MSDQSSTNGNADKSGASGSVDQAPASATERAHAMRATLSARSEAEALLAEASQARRTAATDAETMVAEAEALAEQLVSEAQESSPSPTTRRVSGPKASSPVLAPKPVN